MNRTVYSNILILLTTLLLLFPTWAAISMLAPNLDVSERIKLANSNLVKAHKSGFLKVNSDLSDMPPPQVKDATQRKRIFIAALLPLILQENRRVKEQRALASSLPEDGDAYKKLALDYSLDAGVSRDQLLNHVDIVPVSLILAQSALESGWGRSRFARDGNAFFGERTFDMDDLGMIPKKVDPQAQSFKVKEFSRAILSVRSYIKTLNTNNAYEDLRNRRVELRSKNVEPTGLELVPMLSGYSETGSLYVKRITATIHASRLDTYDSIKLELSR